jgi:hypothetical protein
VDELRMMVNPVVLGSGHPALAGGSLTTLELAPTRDFDSDLADDEALSLRAVARAVSISPASV